MGNIFETAAEAIDVGYKYAVKLCSYGRDGGFRYIWVGTCTEERIDNRNDCYSVWEQLWEIDRVESKSYEA